MPDGDLNETELSEVHFDASPDVSPYFPLPDSRQTPKLMPRTVTVLPPVEPELEGFFPPQGIAGRDLSLSVTVRYMA